MEFRTKVSIPEMPFRIDRETSLLSIGSCFSQRIGQRLNDQKFRIEVDPFGVLYDPISIAKALVQIAGSNSYTEADLHENEGCHFSFDHSTLFSGRDKAATLNRINSRIRKAHGALKGTPVVMITLGTAWAFRHKAAQAIVANCHKLPGELFERELLSVEEITTELLQAIKAVKAVAPATRFLFTVSPVRHLRDGLVNDQLGKSILFVALNDLKKLFPEVHYFPAYELLQHELRDYRFYAEDMAHPSDQATDFIFEKFEEVLIDPIELPISKELDAIHTAMDHRPFDPGSEKHQAFLEAQIAKLEQLGLERPSLDLSNELGHFRSALSPAE